MNLLEKAMSFISPRWGMERMAFTEAQRYYEAGEVNRFHHKWIPVNDKDQENMDKTERDLIRARARWLERNSDMANAAITAIERNVVSTGIHLQARTDNEQLNKQIEQLFERWCRSDNCDITGQQNFYELQRMILRRKMVDGEILVKKVMSSKRTGTVPFKLQAIRADMLDNSLMYGKNGNVIRSGIELNDVLKPVAYWIEQKTPDGYTTLDPKRIPAEDILHIWSKKYPDQIRGVSDLAVSIKRIKDTDEYLDAETIAAKIAACFSIFIIKPQLQVGRNFHLKDKDGRPLTRVNPGMITELGPGEDIKVAQPGRTSSTAKEFVNVHERLIGSGLGLSYEMMSRDFNHSSYSAARQGNLEDRKTFEPMQDWLIEHFCKPVYEAFLDAAVLAGEIDLPGYWDDKERYQKSEWVAPGWASIDPTKETDADFKSLQNGMLTLSQQCAEHGYDWRDQLDQMAREKEYAESLGLVLNIHTPEAVQAAESNHVNESEGSDDKDG